METLYICYHCTKVWPIGNNDIMLEICLRYVATGGDFIYSRLGPTLISGRSETILSGKFEAKGEPVGEFAGVRVQRGYVE